MGWIDVVVIALIVICAVIGLSKGLFESILSLFGTVVSLGISIWLAKPATQLLSKLVDIDGFFEGVLEGWGVGNAAGVSNIVSMVVVAIVIFILIKLVILLLGKLFDSMTRKSSTISGLNRLFGLVFGAIKGGAIVLCALVVTSIISLAMPTLGEKIDKQIEKSAFTNYIYKYVDDWTVKNLKDKIDDIINKATTEQTEEQTEEQTQDNTIEASANAAGSQVVLKLATYSANHGYGEKIVAVI